MNPSKLEALHIVALSIDAEAKRKRGDSKGAAKAKKLHGEAVRIWKKQLQDRIDGKCPHCGKRPWDTINHTTLCS